MREFKRGDVVRLLQNLPADTTHGVKSLQVGWEFEVLSSADGNIKVRDRNGVKSLLPVYAIELVRSAHSPDDDPPPASGGDDGDSTGGGPVGQRSRVMRMPKRKGVVTIPRAA